MCYIWAKQKQTKELSIDEIKYIFNDRLINNNLEIVNITGGEPTLRDDLVEIIRVILKKCTHLKRIDISTNGVNTKQIVDQFERILAILLPENVKLTASISLDGIGETYERVRGMSDIFVNVEKTIKELKELMSLYPFFSMGINMTISKLNYDAIEEVRKYVTEQGLGINFTLAAISEIGVESARVRERFEMDQEEKNKVALSLEDLSGRGAIDQRYAQFILTWLRTGKRKGGCAFKQGKAFLLEPNGEAYLCGNFREFKIGNILAEPLEKIWRNSSNILKHVLGRCSTCVSNCYIG
jgi:MoaA/NifB/PqqE/SkfB family radical SAM enzyme